MSMKTLSPDVVVVGAGIAGVPLAILLQRKGLEVILIERAAAPKSSFKGEYMQPSVVDFYLKYGFGEIYRAKSSAAVEELRFRDLNMHGEVEADLLMTYQTGKHARSISQGDLSKGLFKLAARELGANFWPGSHLTSLDENTATFALSPTLKVSRKDPLTGEPVDTVLNPKWVVGCDGRQSSVRRFITGTTKERSATSVTWGSGSELIFGSETSIEANKASRYEVVRSFGQGTLSFFSLGETGQRIYYSSPNDSGGAKARAQLQMGELLHTIGPMVGMTESPAVTNLQGFSADTVASETMGRGRVILCGDAAGVTTPYGGQGMTVAIEDVNYLASEFNWAVETSMDVSREQRSYARFVTATLDRVNLLNFGLYYLFFARQSLFKVPTRYLCARWSERKDLGARIMGLFSGLDRDKPTVPELMDMWGVTPEMVLKATLKVPLLNKLRPGFGHSASAEYTRQAK